MSIKLNDAQRKLVADNTRLVPAMLWRYFPALMRNPNEEEDWIQIGMLGLCRAAACFQPDRDIAFSTYATQSIRTAVSKEIEKQYTLKRGRGALCRSLDDIILGSDSNYGSITLKEVIPDPADGPETTVETAILLEKLLPMAPLHAERYERSCSQSDLAKLHGISRQALNQRYAREQAQLKQFYDEYMREGCVLCANE